jgi:hypothetical protein
MYVPATHGAHALPSPVKPILHAHLLSEVALQEDFSSPSIEQMTHAEHVDRPPSV